MRNFKNWLIGLLAAIAMFLGMEAYTDDNTLSWDAPTLLEDGSPLTDLSQYKVYYSKNGAPFALLDTVPATGTTYLHANRLDGEHCYYVTAVRANGLESVPSNTACKVIDTILPGAPSNLTVS